MRGHRENLFANIFGFLFVVEAVLGPKTGPGGPGKSVEFTCKDPRVDNRGRGMPQGGPIL